MRYASIVGFSSLDHLLCHGKAFFQAPMYNCFIFYFDKILRAEKLGGGKGKSMTWSAVVHVVLVQAQSLMAMDAGMSSDPYCKLSLGKEKFKSKSKSETINPKWRESFDFNWYEEFDNELEVSVWDKDVGSKDDFMGR